MSSTRTASGLYVSRVTDLSTLASSAADWNRLAADVPFRRWEWVESWWKHYHRPGMHAYVLTVHEVGGELVGLLPCYATMEPLAGRVLRFMGSGEICSDYLTLLSDPGCEQVVAESVGRWLSETSAGEWDLVDLDGVDQTDRSIECLIDWLRSRGHTVHVRQRLNCWRLTLPATWEEYLTQVSKGRRVRIRQIVKRQFETGRAVAHVARTVEEFDHGFQILCDLHQRRRQSLGESGCFVSDRFSKFHAEVSRRFFEAGQLRLHWVELEGVPVAIDYAFTGGGTVYCYQSGMDPRYIDAQPGWLDWTASIRRSIDEGFRSFDFMRGDEPYKASWRAKPIPLQEIRIVGRQSTARIRNHLWSAGVSAKLGFGAATNRVQQWLSKQSGKLTSKSEAEVETVA